MPKLPRYVFRRANGSFRYKRNVPKELKRYILKDTLYRQLGATYDEAIANLPRVHREIEQIFAIERMLNPSQRAMALIAANLGDVWARAAEEGKVGQDEPGMLPPDEYEDLADELEGSRLPREVIDRVRWANIEKAKMTLERVFLLYCQDKAKVQGDVQQRALEQRIERLRSLIMPSIARGCERRSLRRIWCRLQGEGPSRS